LGIRKGEVNYYVWQGEIYPSVTTILQVIAKPALAHWAAQKVAEAAVSQAASLARLAKADPAAAIAKLKSAPWREMSSAADTGTALHKAAEALALGGRFRISPAVAPAVEGLLAFIRERQPRFLFSEVTVYSKTYGYAGTLDAIIELDGKNYIVDFKTSKAIYPEYELQLAAYAHADFMVVDEKEQESVGAGHEVAAQVIQLGYGRMRGAILRLDKCSPGRYEWVEVDISDQPFKVFLSAMEVWKWLRQWRV
jgi:hypothetical protein